MKHNWEYKRLGDVCSLSAGGDKPTDISDVFTSEFSIPIYSNGIENEGLYGFCKCSKINSPAITISGRGTLGVPFLRTKPFVPIIRLIVAIPNDDLDLKFLYYWIVQRKFTGNGGTIPQLTVPMIRNEQIPIPKLEQQKRIVAELDKINEVIADCRELLRNLDALAQSLFHSYFDSIKETVDLSYYVDRLTGGKSLAGKEPSKFKVLKSGAVTYDYFDQTATKFLPLDYTPSAIHEVHKGDLIISRMNTAELVGACAYVFDVDNNCYLPDRLWRIEYNEKAHPIFLWFSLISSSAKEQIRAKASGTSGSMKNISKPFLLSVRIKNAPLALQEQFAAQVERIEEQKKAVEATIAELQTLLDSRMDYWFN